MSFVYIIVHETTLNDQIINSFIIECYNTFALANERIKILEKNKKSEYSKFNIIVRTIQNRILEKDELKNN